jgi:hypothetical protein
MSCRDPWACHQPCDGTCADSPYGRVLTMTSGVGATVRTAPGRRAHASTQGLDPTPRGEREKGPDMQNTQQSPPTVSRREKWRLIGRRPIQGLPHFGDYYLWERDEPGAMYPMRYGIPVGQFWVS